MSIPKVIHYCWFGGNKLPNEYVRYIKSWKKYCPDYEIKQWNEQNFDFSQNKYAQQAYQQKKWAFVSDYVRLKVIYDYGGIYLDTDVELLKSLDDLLGLKCFLGFQDTNEIATGLGFGAEKGNSIIKALLDSYDGISFIKPDGTLDITDCPRRNTEILVKCGFIADGHMQSLGGVTVFPAEYFCPIGFCDDSYNVTKNTYSIHHYSASWLPANKRRKLKCKKALRRLLGHGALYQHVKRSSKRAISLFKKLLHK